MRAMLLVLAGIQMLAPVVRAASLPDDYFVNPIAEGADPWVVRDEAGGRYLWCFSEGNRGIAIHASDRLTALGRKRVVWRAPEKGPYARQVWAPELLLLDGRWHIYFAASDGRNETHLAYVLRARSEDPLGEYELFGPFATGEGADGRSPNIWAIDMTVLEHGGRRYALWSGWDAPGTDQQYLYIAPMKSPVELSGPRVRLFENDDYEWERTEPGPQGRGLNEGPQVLRRAGRTFVVYSCGASWLTTYKLGLLELIGQDPLDPASWRKFSTPVFTGTDQTFGVGHSCFMPSPDGREWWHIFHAKLQRAPGWRRAIYAQPMTFAEDGMPLFGAPVEAGTPLRRPSGEVAPPALTLPFRRGLRREEDFEGWNLYGHHQMMAVRPDGLHLGIVTASELVNDYRSGEKVMLDGSAGADMAVEVSVQFRGEGQARDAGILFRVSGPSVGYDAQRGYFAGLIPRDQRVILGRTDGRNWHELARADAAIDPSKVYRLRVEALGARLTVLLDEARILTVVDEVYASGSCGLRVVDTHAVFSDFAIFPLRQGDGAADGR